ncbi:MAG: ammonium transporter [Pseudomonadota bacterium]
MKNRLAVKSAAVAVSILGVGVVPALAQPDAEVQYIFNSLMFLIGGFLVMFMAAGFCMLEAGLVRSKNVADICLKNISLYALAGIMYYVVGYNLMYTNVGDFVGTFSIWGPGEFFDSDITPEAGGYASASDWFFQMVFVATAASIVSGAVAERVKLSSFLIFVVILTGLIYPIQGAWKWGGGFLEQNGFMDFAGSTIVHSVGGWAALVGALMIGPRTGKYGDGGRVTPMPGSSLPLATLGTFVLWLGWFGFNGASQLALGTAADAVAISQIFANTNMAAAGGVVAALILTKILYHKVDLTMVLNGALAGLVSITAEPLTPNIGEAILIGATGSVLVTLAIPLLDKFKIDDVVGAIPVHLVAGIFGTLVVPVTNGEASFAAQIVGVVCVAAWVVPTSAIAWAVLKFTLGIRLSPEEELAGGDVSELGLEAYPEFVDRTAAASYAGTASATPVSGGVS